MHEQVSSYLLMMMVNRMNHIPFGQNEENWINTPPDFRFHYTEILTLGGLKIYYEKLYSLRDIYVMFLKT